MLGERRKKWWGSTPTLLPLWGESSGFCGEFCPECDIEIRGEGQGEGRRRHRARPGRADGKLANWLGVLARHGCLTVLRGRVIPKPINDLRSCLPLTSCWDDFKYSDMILL